MKKHTSKMARNQPKRTQKLNVNDDKHQSISNEDQIIQTLPENTNDESSSLQHDSLYEPEQNLKRKMMKVEHLEMKNHFAEGNVVDSDNENNEEYQHNLDVNQALTMEPYNEPLDEEPTYVNYSDAAYENDENDERLDKKKKILKRKSDEYEMPAVPKHYSKIWSIEMDDILAEAVNRYGNNWKMVAEFVQHGMTNEQCRHRWNAAVKPKIQMARRGRWKPDEVDNLIRLVQAHQATVPNPYKLVNLLQNSNLNAADLPPELPDDSFKVVIDWPLICRELNRSTKDCKDKWCSIQRRQLKKDSFTDEEDAIIMDRVLMWNKGDRAMGLWSGLGKDLGRDPRYVNARWNTVLCHRNPANYNHIQSETWAGYPVQEDGVHKEIKDETALYDDSPAGHDPSKNLLVMKEENEGMDEEDGQLEYEYSKPIDEITSEEDQHLSHSNHRVTQLNDIVPGRLSGINATYEVYNQESNTVEVVKFPERYTKVIPKRWTKDMDELLIDGVRRFGNNWKAVSDFVANGRTNEQCRQRWTSFLSPLLQNRKKGRWTTAEVQQLTQLIEENQIVVDNVPPGAANSAPTELSDQYRVNINWSAICKLMNRSTKDCKDKWNSIRKANLKKGPFTMEDDEIIIQRVKEWGDKGPGLWAALEKELGRPSGLIGHRWKTSLVKQFI